MPWLPSDRHRPRTLVQTPGFIWGARSPRQRARQPRWGAVLSFAHGDLSGISVFEEAVYWGIEAAKAILRRRRTAT